MENKFKPSDKVRLGVDSEKENPVMFVEHYGEGEVHGQKWVLCSWFVNGEKKSEAFAEDSLILVT